MTQEDRTTPPPFPGRRDKGNWRCSYRPGRMQGGYRSGRGGGQDWAEDFLGKPRDMSWSAYLGLGGLGGRHDRRYDEGGAGGWYGTSANGAAQGAAMDAGRGQETSSMNRMDPYYRSPNPNRLYRNKREGKLGGVCAGIADYFNVDSALIRIGVVLGLFISGPIFLVGYVILWMILKERPTHLFDSPEEEVFWRSVTTKPDQTLAGLRSKFRTLEQEISAMEGYVASPEFTLNRQFKDLEKN